MFSIIIPVHNKYPHIDRAVNSVLNQTFQDFEIILIDDASTDGSSNKINQFTDKRIKKLKRDLPGPGGYAARNLGITNAKYDWITFLDADDEWSPDFLTEFSKAISKNPKVYFYSCSWQSKYEEDQVNFKEDKSKETKYTSFELIDYLKDPKFVWTCALVVHKNLIKKAKPFPDDGICQRGGDVDTWIRWLYNSNKNIHIEKNLAYYYRDTVNQVTRKPNTVFCSYDTLMKIYDLEKNNILLKKAIKSFVNKFIYGMLYRQVKAGMPLDYKEIKKMFFSKYSILRVIKLHSIKLIG